MLFGIAIGSFMISNDDLAEFITTIKNGKTVTAKQIMITIKAAVFEIFFLEGVFVLSFTIITPPLFSYCIQPVQ